jgi:hypothetical protein
MFSASSHYCLSHQPVNLTFMDTFITDAIRVANTCLPGGCSSHVGWSSGDQLYRDGRHCVPGICSQSYRHILLGPRTSDKNHAMTSGHFIACKMS